MILENFMPPGIHCNLVHEQIDDFPLTEQERDLTAQWRSNKRLLEFHQGRSAAKLGLQQAGFAAAHYSILPDASGCPIWPSD
ncbi:MAG: hypothetical protein KDD62_06325, partial [Bdellovibrionales bacterium]|nr:hypothetical protein [Bdellovibrionales bacterium]